MKNIKLIKTAAERLVWALDNQNVNYSLKLIELCTKEEKGHRGFGPEFAKYHPNAISAPLAGKLFAVRRVAEYILRPDAAPKATEYLHTQTSCFMAAAIAHEFRDRILKQWEGLDIESIAALDYCEYVKAECVD